MALFVLGAGATRACSFVEPKKHPCIPPLDADFFTQLQRVRNPKHQPLIKQVMADVVRLFGHNFRATLETMFATVEHTLRMLDTTGAGRAFSKDDLKRVRGDLLAAIAVAMEEALMVPGDHGTSKREPRICEHHQKFVEKVLVAPDDAVVSFNYDCVIDDALKRFGDGKWNPRYGYALPLGARGKRMTGDGDWQSAKPAAQKQTLHLYKLHGSLHFQVDAKDPPSVHLKKLPYTKLKGTPKFTIIPPESNKAYDKGVFRELWKKAALAIGRATEMAFIGYSLPLTDLHATALFRTSVKPGALRALVVVNPDREARRRTREVLQRGLSVDTRVLSFDSFAEFLALDPSVWRQPAVGTKPPSPRGNGKGPGAGEPAEGDVEGRAPLEPSAGHGRAPGEGAGA